MKFNSIMFVSPGRMILQLLAIMAIVACVKAAVAAPASSPVYDVVFVGDSITYGANLSDPTTEAPPTRCAEELRHHYHLTVLMSNQGHGGHTTVDWLPSTNSRSDFQGAIVAAAELEKKSPGSLIFSIMLGANDSAQRGPKGSPVSPAKYLQNLQSIVDGCLDNYTNAFIIVHYPTWYSTNTENTSLYAAAGLARLQAYFPQIDQLIANCAVSHPGHVFAGDKLAFDYFSTNYLNHLTPESGRQGTFYLHPNRAGAVVLAKFWADAIVNDLKLPF